MKTSKESFLNSNKKEIERELGEFTFEERLKATSDGSYSIYRKKNQEKKPARANKNRPMEVSCKKPVSRFREVIQVPKRFPFYVLFFVWVLGGGRAARFRKRYDFLFKDNLPAEREELQKQLKKSKDPKVKDELKIHISWIVTEHKKKEREAAKQGKRPFYLKKSEIRKQRLVDKYKSLKEAGKLESFIEKKRRKNAAKDQRYMPYRRPSDEQQS
ncbi:rRNA biogenesis protein RRP36 [Dillenia turbinata]|uniref:rRNA biogenesis protein RRP36 n=1 Tax=Dillenia turbinata TaxID=194707 RepID=A0AAN8ZIB3_9MAGN